MIALSLLLLLLLLLLLTDDDESNFSNMLGKDMGVVLAYYFSWLVFST